MSDLVDEWIDLNNNKNGYAFGDNPFDRTAFNDLIRKTLEELKKFKEELHVENPLDNAENITPYDIIMYSSLTEDIIKEYRIGRLDIRVMSYDGNADGGHRIFILT